MVSLRTRKKSLAVNERGYVVGEQHHRAKLTDHEVDLVLELVDQGMPPGEVARKFDISRRTVRDYVEGRIRSHTIAGHKLAVKACSKE
jgi:DNA-binding NarL/FixJ family response regulator